MTRRPPKPAGRDWLEHMKLHSDYPATGCWELRGYRDRDGYGKITIPGDATYQSHRYAYMRLVDSALTASTILRHKCDNPICWNPEHLLPGTHADNVADKVERKRHHWGERTPSAKLNPDKVRAIRARHAAGENTATIAESFGVSPRAVRFVVLRETWAHVE